MIPESAAERSVDLYRCESFPERWCFEKRLLDDLLAVDATLAEIDGRWWMFVNIAVPGSSPHDELHLFYADTPLGPWQPHRRNPVKSDVRSSRPAGRLFHWKGKLCRPAQNCGPRYGHGIVFNSIVTLNPCEYQEVAVSSLEPTWEKGLLGSHTINTAGRLTVIDALKRRRFR